MGTITLWHTLRSCDRVKGHMTRSFKVKLLAILNNRFWIATIGTCLLQLQPNLFYRHYENLHIMIYFEVTWRGWRSCDKVVSGQIVIDIYINLFFFELLLCKQVCFIYIQTGIIVAQWQPSCYDTLRGHTTKSKVTGGWLLSL